MFSGVVVWAFECFFCKQETAYEMRMSDWSSDVCSSDLIVLLIALLVVASMFVGVCDHAYTRYSEIHTGRATWGQFGLTVAVGAILLVVGIWLLTKATGVL